MEHLARIAPWFRRGFKGNNLDTEPLSYRAWKRLAQIKGYNGDNADLIPRIDQSDWDLLIILDACRYEILASIANDVAVNRAISPATTTKQFLDKTRAAGLFDGVTYVSANPQTEKHRPGNVSELIPVYEESWDESLQTVPPSSVYDAAEKQVRSGKDVVAHTMQPHYPHICKLGDSTRPVPGGLHPDNFSFQKEGNFKIQSILARGIIDLDTAFYSYYAAAKFAWKCAKDVALKLADGGYTTLITADHGELFGEWGFVEHPYNVPISELIAVPWIEIRPFRRERTSASSPKPGVEDKLSALGYVE